MKLLNETDISFVSGAGMTPQRAAYTQLAKDAGDFVRGFLAGFYDSF
jgi:hypothetical protein